MFKGKSLRKINCQKDSLGNFVKKTHLEIKSKRITWKFCQKESPGKICQKESLGNFVKKNPLDILSKRITWKFCQKELPGNLVKKTHLEIKSDSSLHPKPFCQP